ncbi:MAG: Ppx/GppA family phosphatase [Pseudomonadota bacterium]
MRSKKRWGEREGAFSGLIPERAIIDIGSNTVRLVIYGGSMRAPTVLLNEKVTARLGRDIAAHGILAKDAVELALRGLRRFVLLLEDLDVSDVVTVATAAVRDASNGSEFVAELARLGLDPRILSGEQEGEISATGVLGAFPGAAGVVADLGGGSLELATLDGHQPVAASSLPLGTLRLPDHRGENTAEMLANLERVLMRGGWDKVGEGERDAAPLYLVGGTWRAMAVYAMQLEGHPLSDPHGFAIAPDDAYSLIDQLVKETSQSLKARERISSMRAEKLPDAAVLLRALLARLGPSRIVFSSWGLREGLLFDQLPPDSKGQDPLLAGISAFAGQRGTSARFAARMAGWTVDAAPAQKHGSERLRLAATMLALASMQIEPNIRMPQAIDWALHKRWIAVDDEARAMLAAAIAANGNHLNLPRTVRALASKQALEEAICWGLAIRLARRLGARSQRSLQASRLTVERGKLILRLAQSRADLFGVPVEKDLKLLAGRLGLDWSVKTVADECLHEGSADK